MQESQQLLKNKLIMFGEIGDQDSDNAMAVVTLTWKDLFMDQECTHIPGF